MDTTSLHHSLKRHFGFEQFREGQCDVVQTLLAGHSSLAIFPTGSGKSLCYQLAALHMPNLTLVVSPLLALIQDQLAFLHSKGISAASIDSSLSYQQNQAVMQDIRSGTTQILFVSVERFKNERFRHFIEQVKLSMLVIDEAHCISEWGHNFRPDYLKLPDYKQQLCIPQVLLLTATATPKVMFDMASKFAIEQHNIVKTGFYRANLDLQVQACAEPDKKTVLLNYIEQNSGACIVYVTLQKSADAIAKFLKGSGVNACSYHAGLEHKERTSIQSQFMDNQLQVVVATIAFGMGVDKANIRSVIHYDLPKSIENYSQEVGRAGRDGRLSACIVLANLDGLSTLENFVYGDTPDLPAIQRVISDIKQGTQESEWELQHYSLSNQTNIRQLTLKTLLVKLEMLGVITPLYSYFADFKFKFNQSKEQILANFDDDRRAFLHGIFDFSPVKKVWASLDMNALQKALQYERTRVIAALDYLHEKNFIELESKRNTEVYKVNISKLNAPALAHELLDYFNQNEQTEIARIQHLVSFLQTDECLSYSLSEYFGDENAPKKCGHCSVCSGHIAVLDDSSQRAEPNLAELSSALQGLASRLQEKLNVPLDHATSCRFLAGITSPFLTRLRARSMQGYSSCSDMRYADIRKLVDEVLAS